MLHCLVEVSDVLDPFFCSGGGAGEREEESNAGGSSSVEIENGCCPKGWAMEAGRVSANGGRGG